MSDLIQLELGAEEPQRKRIKPSLVQSLEGGTEKELKTTSIVSNVSLKEQNCVFKNVDKANNIKKVKQELEQDVDDEYDSKIDENNVDKLHNDDSVSNVSSENLGETEKENIANSKDIVDRKPETPSTSGFNKPAETLEIERKLNKFLDLVKYTVKKSQFEDVITKKCLSVEKYFEKCGTNVNEKSFIKLLRDCTFNMENATAAGATIAFHKIYEHLKLLSEKSQAEIMPEDVHRVRKLEKMLTSLMRKIHKLEQTEINFDDEEDSTYMQIDRYKIRVKKVYERYCEIIDKNPNSGRLTYEKINFKKSSYKEINDAINKKFKNSLNFPSYYEMEQFIWAVVKEKRLDVSKSRVKSESKKCFKALGKILQKRRRAELYDCHLSFIEGTEDPASGNPGLEKSLRKNFVEGEEKFNQLLHSYIDLSAKIQEKDIEEDCSHESSGENG